jgi:O-antigen ligase
VGGLAMTQSRGPWAGAGLAVVFAMLVHWFSVRRAALLFVLLMAVVGAAGYYYGKQYTAGQLSDAHSLEQQDAIYRKQLLHSYLPLVAKRKVFGYGITNLPTINGQKSIDNEFLWLAATQGLVGLGLFLAIGAGCGMRLFRQALRPIGRLDQTMLFAHLAVLMGVLATLTTVYLGETMFIFFFLLAGWMDGMNPARVEVRRPAGFVSAFRFQRVLV